MSQRNITIEYDQIALALGDLSSEGETIQLPEIAGSYLGNTNGFEYFPEVYYEFRAILDNYRALLCRDITMTSDMIGCFIAFDQQALTDYRNYNQDFSFNSPCPTPSQTSTQVLSASNLSSSEPSQYTFDASAVGTEDFYISMAEIEDMCTEIINNATTLMNSCDSYSTVIDNLVNTQGFLGQAAEALKNYWSNVHCACIAKIHTAALTLADHVSAYWLNYNDSPALLASIPGGTFILQKCELDSARSILVDFDVGFEPLHTDVTTAISTASSSTSGAYDYSGYTPDYAALSEMVQANIGRIDAISNAVFGIEAGVIDSDRQLINDSISDLNDFINSVIANINEYNITNQENGIPCSISSDYQDLAESVSTDLIEHQNYDDVLTEGVSRARNHAYQDALDDRRTQIEFEIATDIFMIAVSIASIVGTCGSDAPIAVSVIIANVDAISLCFASSDLVEDGQTYYYVQQGDLYTEGTNYMYEAYYEPLGLSRESYNNTERVFFFITSVSCEINSLSYANGNYGAGVARAFALEGTGELAGDAAYQIAIDCGASPMQALLISMVAESGTSFGLESVWDEPGTFNAARIGSSDVDDISYGGSYHVDDVADDIGDNVRHLDVDDVDTSHQTVDVDAFDDPAQHVTDNTSRVDVNDIINDSDTDISYHPIMDSDADFPRQPNTVPPNSLDNYEVIPVVNDTNLVGGHPADSITPSADDFVGTTSIGRSDLPYPDVEVDSLLVMSNADIINNFDTLTGEQLYNIAYIRNSGSDKLFEKLSEYDLITADNIKTYLYPDLNGDDLVLMMHWPEAGGFDVSTIRSLRDSSGIVSVSRSGNIHGSAFAIDENGVIATNSQRSIPASANSSAPSYQGNLNLDTYNSIIDTLTTNTSETARDILRSDFGYSDAQIDKIFEQWDGQYSYFGRAEYASATSAIYQSGRTIDSRYGFVGDTAAWDFGGVNMTGGARQITSVFNWELLESLNVISDTHPIPNIQF